MRNSITTDETSFAFHMQENSTKQNNVSESVSDLEARIAELEMELKKQKAAAEKGVKLMQIIWGDKFQSDSLH
jgi:uncharacterized small protein (DUF1192 family)